MYLVEKISNKLVDGIASVKSVSDDEKQVLVYGAVTLLQTMWVIILTALMGLVFQVFYETMIFLFSGAILRKYSGGAHVPSPNRCAFIGAVIATAFAFIAKGSLAFLNYIIVLVNILLFLTAYYLIHRYAPVDSPAKPIKKEHMREKLKKSSFKMLNVLALIYTVLLCIYMINRQEYLLIYSNCIALGIIWQCFTLTESGYAVIHFMDVLLINITSLVGGEKL